MHHRQARGSALSLMVRRRYEVLMYTQDLLLSPRTEDQVTQFRKSERLCLPRPFRSIPGPMGCRVWSGDCGLVLVHLLIQRLISSGTTPTETSKNIVLQGVSASNIPIKKIWEISKQIPIRGRRLNMYDSDFMSKRLFRMGEDSTGGVWR